MLGNALNEAFKVVHFKTISVNIYYVQRFVAFHIDVDLVISRREKILKFSFGNIPGCEWFQFN